MNHSVFRQKSMEKITSPEQMNDYIRVSNPSVWMILAAVIVLLIGVCVWGAFGHLDTVVQTGGICEDGRLTVYLKCSPSQGHFHLTHSGSIPAGYSPVVM